MAGIQLVRKVSELRAALEGTEVSFVPTMGSLHEGHASLVQLSAQDRMTTVTSIFVNPTQFGDPNDLASYPRDLKTDVEIAEKSGCDIIFAPSVEEMYPQGDATRVRVSSVAEEFEGKHRPGHFEGVATVVAKLFIIIQPNVAWFGEKDWQQCCVVSRMVSDLHMPIELRFAPTVREKDGLAMSSRNVRLDSQEREKAPLIFENLSTAAATAREGGDMRLIEREAVRRLTELGFDVDYFNFVNPQEMTPAVKVEGSRIVTAASIGGVRLIDNLAV